MAVMTKTPGGEEIVILSRAEYDALKADHEDRADAAAARKVIGRLDRGDEETLTSEEMKELLAAPTPLYFWRRKRRFTQQALAQAAKLSQGFLSEIESGKKTGDVASLKAISNVLGVGLDDLVVEG